LPRVWSRVALVALLFATTGASAQAPSRDGLIVSLDGAGWNAFGPGVCDATWRVQTIEPGEPEVPPASPVAGARARYVEADNLGCLEALPAGLEEDLLAAERRDEAAGASTLRAACAFGAGRADEARRLVATALARDAIATSDLRQTTPEFQELVESARAAMPSAVPVRIEVEPRDAIVEIDGVERCRQTPCTVALVPEAHVIVAWGLGLERRVLVDRVEGAIDLTLHPSSSAEAARDLARAVALDLPPDSPAVARAVRLAFGADVFLVTRSRGDRIAAALYGTTSARGAISWTVARSDAGSLETRVAGRCAGTEREEDEGGIGAGVWIAIGAGAAVAIALGILLPVLLWPDPVGRIEFQR
jgi:hypothetical protein